MSVAGVVTRGAAAIVPRLSFPLASGLGRALGAVAWALDGRHRRVAVDNLAVAFPAMPEAQRQRLALRAFQQSGRTAVEMLWSASLDDRTLADVAVFEGVRHIDEALAAGSGALITTAHFGNWELMGVALAHIGIPMNVIARRVDDDQVEEVLHGLRERTGARVIHKQEAVRAALRALRDNKVVGVLIDQNTIPGRGAFVPFFGRLAATTEIASQLHVRTGAPIVMLFCIPGRRPLSVRIRTAGAPAAKRRPRSGGTAAHRRGNTTHRRSYPPLPRGLAVDSRPLAHAPARGSSRRDAVTPPPVATRHRVQTTHVTGRGGATW